MATLPRSWTSNRADAAKWFYWKGELDYHYEDDEHRLRVNWIREKT